jgi:hypothetical protein
MNLSATGERVCDILPVDDENSQGIEDCGLLSGK